jgi:hypothetical protein
MAKNDQAKGIASHGDPTRQQSDGLSPSLEAEVYASLCRALVQHKADEIAGECGVDRSTFYRWQAKPRRVPIGALPALAHMDPDPEFLSRVCGHLLAHVARGALARQAAGRSALIVQEISPGKWGTTR